MSKKVPKKKYKPKRNGRPTVYRKKEHDERAYKFTLLGMGDEELAMAFDVMPSTIAAWKLKHKGFSESLTRGKADADANVADRLYQRAMGYSHRAEKIFQHNGEIIRAEYTEHYPPEVGAATLWLKNRQKLLWRDKIDHEVFGRDGGPIEQVTTTMTPEEATRIYRERMARFR